MLRGETQLILVCTSMSITNEARISYNRKSNCDVNSVSQFSQNSNSIEQESRFEWFSNPAWATGDKGAKSLNLAYNGVALQFHE